MVEKNKRASEYKPGFCLLLTVCLQINYLIWISFIQRVWGPIAGREGGSWPLLGPGLEGPGRASPSPSFSRAAMAMAPGPAPAPLRNIPITLRLRRWEGFWHRVAPTPADLQSDRQEEALGFQLFFSQPHFFIEVSGETMLCSRKKKRETCMDVTVQTY